MLQVKQSSAVIHFVFLMVDSTDHITGKTGLSPTVTISKNAGAFASPSGAITEIAHGWYKLAANATDCNTLGVLALHATATGADPTDVILANIVAYDPQDAVRAGLTALPNAAAEAAGGLYTRGTGAGQINQPANGMIDVNAVQAGGTAWGSGAVTAASLAADAGVEVAAAVWDRVLTGATHNIANSAGRRLRLIDAAFEVHSGTAQAGSTATTFVMDTGASAVDSIYNGDRIVITAGTGAEEHGLIISYVGATRTATMSKAWVVTPDATSEFSVVPADCDIETWNHAAVTGNGDWALLQADADNIQTRLPAALVSGRIDASVGAMAANVLTASALATDAVAEIADQVWDEILGGHLGVGSTGEGLNNAGAAGTPPTAAAIADQVWDEAVADHRLHGTMGSEHR